MELTKFRGIFPAFYACYDDQGEISEERTRALVEYLHGKRVQGLYVGGSSGECIYHSLEERMKVLTYTAEAARGKLALIAHVGAPSTRDSIILARHAAELGYDALSAIPPIYYKLPDSTVMRYWNDIIDATPLGFIIYNIPQTTGYQLSTAVLEQMLRNPKVIGVKNSSMPTLDIERFKRVGGERFIVFNGPDEQYVSGRIMGADAGIGGTYGAMPELYLKAEQLVSSGRFDEARRLQSDINEIIMSFFTVHGSMYAVIKEILKRRGVHIGSVRAPFEPVAESDLPKIDAIIARIDETIRTHCKE